MQQKADEVAEAARKEAEAEAERERKRKIEEERRRKIEEARRARMAAARKKRKPTIPGSGRKPRKIVDRPPIAISVKEALRIVPIGRSKLFQMLQDGTIKSSLVAGVRAIDFESLRKVFAPTEEFVPQRLHMGMSGAGKRATTAPKTINEPTKALRTDRAERERAEARRDPRQQPLPLVSQL